MTILKAKLLRSSPQSLKGFLEAVDRMLAHPRKTVGHDGLMDDCGEVFSIGGFDDDVDDKKTTRPSNWIGLEYLDSASTKGVKEVFPTSLHVNCVGICRKDLFDSLHEFG
jgi:hypothetical protein